MTATETKENQDKWIICRICLQSSDHNMELIFDDDKKLVENINICTNFQLLQHNELPDQICITCQLLLKAALKFRMMCQRSQEHLAQVLEIPTMKPLENIKVMKPELRYASDATNDTTYDIDNGGSGNQIDNNIIETVDVFSDDGNTQTTNFNVEYLSDDLLDELPQPKQPKIRVSHLASRKEYHRGLVTMKDLNSETVLETDTTSGPTFMCSICGNIYMERCLLTKHMNIHAIDKPHECEICHKRFRQTPQLTRHMNSHTGNRPYKCKNCSASFADPSTCIKHQRVHTNERPYKCSECGKAFGYSNVLKVHMKIHTGEKTFSRRYCKRGFTHLHHKKPRERSHTTGGGNNTSFSEEE